MFTCSNEIYLQNDFNITISPHIHLSYGHLDLITSPPQGHLGRAHRNSHIGECTLPLCVLAVACTMHNKTLYGVLRDVMEHYGTVMENID